MPFVTFEGIEGCGKSSQARRAAAHYRRAGLDVRLEREPGGTEAGVRIRELLLDPALESLDPLAELLLMEADRRQHVQQVLRPALEEGAVVICDRFNDATFAYQGGGRGLPRKLVEAVDGWAVEGLVPDLTLILDCPVDVGLARANRRDRGNGARFEQESREFHERVRAAYREIAAGDPRRVRLIDSTRPPDEVFEEIRRHLDARLL